MKQKTSTKLPRAIQRQSLFWDTDPGKLDTKKHATYIIERILDFGNDREVRWVLRQYPKRKMRSVMSRPRSVLQPKSKALWSLVLK